MLLVVLLATLAVAAVYLALLNWYVPVDGFWSGDQGAKLVQLQTLLRSHYRELGLPYPGMAIDPAGAFSPVSVMFSWPAHGQAYSIYSYAHAFVTTFPYAAFGYPGLYVIPVMATLATLVTAAAISRRLAVRPAWLLPLVMGLATPLVFYALVLWEHALAVCLTTLAVWCAIKAIEGDHPAWALIGGLLVGCAYWMRNEVLVFAPALCIGLFWAGANRRLLLACVLGLIVGITPLLLFNTFLFGQPLGPDVGINFSMEHESILGGLLRTRLAVTSQLLLDVPDRIWLSAPIMLFALLAALPLPRARPWLLAAMAIAIFYGIANTEPLELRIGIASTSPLVFLAVLARTRLDSERPVLRLLVATAVVYSVGVLSSAPNSGGYAWGPRYLLPVMPLFAVLSISALTTMVRSSRGFQRWASAGAVGLLLVASVSIQYRGVNLLQQSAAQIQRIGHSVDAQKRQVILTDIWYAPQILAPLYLDRTVFLIRHPERLAELSALLRQHQIGGFSYLTSQQWWRDERALGQAGLACSSIEKLPMSLELLDCRAVR